MQPPEFSELRYVYPSNPSQFSAHFGFTSTNSPAYKCPSFPNPLYQPHMVTTPGQFQEFNPPSKCFSSNSTSDEADEQQEHKIINERKKRRMISNRESARRSRTRKQKQLNELWSQVVWLRNENHQLIDKLNHFSESHDQVLQENAQLKEETSELRQMLTDMQINSPFSSLRDQLDGDLSCDLS